MNHVERLVFAACISVAVVSASPTASAQTAADATGTVASTVTGLQPLRIGGVARSSDQARGYRHHAWMTASGATLVTFSLTVWVGVAIGFASSALNAQAEANRCAAMGGCPPEPACGGCGLGEGLGALAAIAVIPMMLTGGILWWQGAKRRPLLNASASPRPDVLIGSNSLALRWTF